MKKNTILSLQGIRAVAFLGLLTFHCGLTLLGEWAVSVFFVLSGFIMMYSYENREVSNSLSASIKFSLSKIRKLYPLHIITMLLIMYFPVKQLISSYASDEMTGLVKQILANVFLVQAWCGQESMYFSLNGVSWFLSVCVFLYFLFPFIHRWFKKHGSNKKALELMVLSVLAMLALSAVASKVGLPQSFSSNPMKWATYIFPIYRLGDFLVGCSMGYLFNNRSEYAVTKSVVAMTLLEVLSLVLIWASHYMRTKGIFIAGNESVRYALVYLPSTVICIYIFALNRGLVSALLSLKPFASLGDLSPYAFLIHMVVIRFYYSICASLNIISGSVLIDLAIILLITLLLSWLYSKLISSKATLK